jgi:hypothetical protein
MVCCVPFVAQEVERVLRPAEDGGCGILAAMGGGYDVQSAFMIPKSAKSRT